VITLWYFTEPLLLACKQPPDVAALSARYTRRLGIGLFPALMFEALKRFLQGTCVTV
jgi:Na+-driven multidrug efflux pump